MRTLVRRGEAHEAETTSRTPQNGLSSPSPAAHALLVDVAADTLRLLKHHLISIYQLTIVPAAACRDALSRLPVHLAVLECQARGSALSLIRQLRVDHSSVPMLVVTADGSESFCAAVFRLGIFDYLPKPVDDALLRGALQRLHPATCPGSIPSLLKPASPEIRALHTHPNIERVLAAAELVRERYADHVTLRGVAREVAMGQFTLSRVFREVFGITFRAYRRRVRIARAIELIRDPRLSLSEIAPQVGYSELSRFNKAFKTETGYPPSVYRKGRPPCDGADRITSDQLQQETPKKRQEMS